jgi:hypothetical protein
VINPDNGHGAGDGFGGSDYQSVRKLDGLVLHDAVAMPSSVAPSRYAPVTPAPFEFAPPPGSVEVETVGPPRARMGDFEIHVHGNPGDVASSLEQAILAAIDHPAPMRKAREFPLVQAVKESNPKQAVANDHVKFSAIPLRVLAGVAVAMSEGAWKYRRHNYRVAGVRASVYFDATLDHLFGWFEGEDIDPDSGRHHIDKAIASLFVLRDAMLGGKCEDDRPPAVSEPWVKDAHAATKELFERMRAKHGEHKPPYVIDGDRDGKDWERKAGA